MNAAELIQKYYIDPIARQQTSVGVEIELPLVSAQNTAVTPGFIRALAGHIAHLGFTETKRTLDGDVCEWVNENEDICSFETTWNTLELSMKNTPSLGALAKRFYALLIKLQEFCTDQGYFLCGRGINPNCASICTAPLRTPILLAKSSYLKQHTKHHDGEIFHSICASVQTHLDATNTDQYIERLNLLRRAYVFDALFFANSMPPDGPMIGQRPALRDIDLDTLCFRDELWRHCDAPNIIDCAAAISNVDGLCRYLMDLKLFILPDGDDFYPIPPISFARYCEQTGNGAAALRCFRSLAPVAPTQKGSLELRSTCTQPLDALFAPSAFYLGLAENHALAKGKIDDIYQHRFSGSTPLQVRDALMKGSNEALRRHMKQDGLELLDIAISGLTGRAYGEERFLLPLRKQFDAADFCLPAQRNHVDAMSQMKRQMHVIGEEYQ